MLDFVKIKTTFKKNTGTFVIEPSFLMCKSKDLMIRGGDFYAIWDEEKGFWSTDEQAAIDLIDAETRKVRDEFLKVHPGVEEPVTLLMKNADSGVIDRWHKYVQKQRRDEFHQLDEKLIFADTPVKKTDYASKTLPYPLENGPYENWDKLVSTLYSEENRRKIEWAIGAVISGDSKKIQKFMVFYGDPGSGKSTILNIIEKLFEGYTETFDSEALGSATNAFAMEMFKTNPLVSFQHDGDLSKINNNARLNSLVSHEKMTVNEKYKSGYTMKFKTFLIMATNKPVKITDSKSGLLRRLIDIHPSGKKLNKKEYDKVMHSVMFELGAIATHCLEVYLDDPTYFNGYVPSDMLGATNDMYNFIEENYYIFKRDDSVTLNVAYKMYKEYCDESNVPYPLSKMVFKEELKSYFDTFEDRARLDNGDRPYNLYSGFLADKFRSKYDNEKDKNSGVENWLKLDKTDSLLDKLLEDCPAQLAVEEGKISKPKGTWARCKTKLKDIDTTQIHYVKPPIKEGEVGSRHIIIDFDLKDKEGNKSMERNLEAASKWPKTYAEFSKSGGGIHLHYLYSGKDDPALLSRIYDEDIEIKVYSGDAAIRRRLSYCNDIPVANISSGLPLKGDKVVVNKDSVLNEKAIRTIIKRAINKEYHADTTSNVNYILKTLDDAYASQKPYDVMDMYTPVLNFAMQSTNQSAENIKKVGKMHFKSDVEVDNVEFGEEAPIVFYDIEIFPNLFVVCWKVAGEGHKVVKMINPKPMDIEMLTKYRLVGFNNRDYDNHIIYAAMIGYSVPQLYNLSNKIINGDKDEARKAKFGEAYNLSYTDVYDFAAKKQGLKKWEIELGIHHDEAGVPWDQPVPEELWERIAEYCCNDVIATEAVFNHLKGDWTARQILAAIAGMTVNDTTNSLTTRIIFGKEKKPNLVYTDLLTGEQWYRNGNKIET